MKYKTVHARVHEVMTRAHTTDSLLTTPRYAAKPGESNGQRTARMSGTELGRLWIGDLVSKTPSASIRDRASLDEALRTLGVGLASYYGTQFATNEADVGAAGALVFGGTVRKTTADGVLGDTPLYSINWRNDECGGRRSMGQETGGVSVTSGRGPGGITRSTRACRSHPRFRKCGRPSRLAFPYAGCTRASEAVA
jgi:hypothetical protein